MAVEQKCDRCGDDATRFQCFKEGFKLCYKCYQLIDEALKRESEEATNDYRQSKQLLSSKTIQIMRKEAVIVAYKDLVDIFKAKLSAYQVGINGEIAARVLQDVIDLLKSFINQFESTLKQLKKGG